MAAPWSRVGLWLSPPCRRLCYVHVLAGKPRRRLVYTVYERCSLCFFLFSPGTFTGHECTGNYVIFQFTPNVTGTYSIYYFGWLLTGIGLGFHWANELKDKGKNAINQLKLSRTDSRLPGVPGTGGDFHDHQPGVPARYPQRLVRFCSLLALIVSGYILPRAAEVKRELIVIFPNCKALSLTKQPHRLCL